MNLLLLPDDHPRPFLPAADARVRHLREVLNLGARATFDVGCENGPRGRASVEVSDDKGLQLHITWGKSPPPPPDLRLWIGLPRPATARKILHEASSLGVAELVFFIPGRGEKSYAEASLWKNGEWRETIRQAAEQAYTTRLPSVRLAGPLSELLATDAGTVLALDNYEAARPLHEALPGVTAPVTLVFGAERGFTDAERAEMRTAGVSLVHLGERVLRAETAVVAATALALAHLGAWTGNTPSSRGL